MYINTEAGYIGGGHAEKLTRDHRLAPQETSTTMAEGQREKMNAKTMEGRLQTFW